jgi:NMD protein affecting ribosome stability and mRNA decay
MAKRRGHLCYNCGEKLEKGEIGVCTFCLDSKTGTSNATESRHASAERILNGRRKHNEQDRD